jgi:hypothetical protein
MPRRLLSTALVSFLPIASALGADALPYRAGLQVVWADQRGPEVLRAEIERLTLEEMARNGCFAEVFALQPGQDARGEVLLRLSLYDLLEETEYDTSLYDRVAPDAPPDTQRQLTAVLSYRVRTEILALPGEVPARVSRFRTEIRWRPRFAGEDARLTAREKAVEETARNARGVACRGSLSRLGRRIEAALASPENRLPDTR